MTRKVNAPKCPSLSERKGLLIVFEGIDGVGKTTQINLLGKHLRTQGYKVLLTREPTEGPYGQKIRDLFVSRQKITPQEELDLFVHDRRQHVKEVIEPALNAGWIVCSDRYYFSTMAYQGAVGLSVPDIRRINEEFAPVPDLVILLVAGPEETVQRIKNNRRERPNTFEKEDYLRRVQDIFLSLEDRFIVRVDGHGAIDAVQTQIRGVVNQVLAGRPDLTKRMEAAG